MKLFKSVLIALCIFAIPAPGFAADIQVYVNGEYAANGRADGSGNVYIPVRSIAERLGMLTAWNPERETVTVANARYLFVLRPQSIIANRDYKTTVVLSAPPEIQNGTTYINANDAAELFGVSCSADLYAGVVNIVEE